MILSTGGEGLLPGEGVPGPRKVCSGGCLVETPLMATAVGGMHPTGMHSYSINCIYTTIGVVSISVASEILIVTNVLNYAVLFLKKLSMMSVNFKDSVFRRHLNQ